MGFPGMGGMGMLGMGLLGMMAAPARSEDEDLRKLDIASHGLPEGDCRNGGCFQEVALRKLPYGSCFKEP